MQELNTADDALVVGFLSMLSGCTLHSAQPDTLLTLLATDP